MLLKSGFIKPIQYGFSLVELLITLAILLIMLSVALPILTDIFMKAEAKNTRYIIKNIINSAKFTSYSEHQRVYMCLLNTNNVCDRNGDEHLILFIDKNKNNKFDSDIDRLIIRDTLNLKYAQVSLRAGGRHYVRFAADSGTPRGFFGHFKYCPVDGNRSNKFQMSFNQVGNIRYKPDSIHPTGC